MKTLENLSKQFISKLLNYDVSVELIYKTPFKKVYQVVLPDLDLELPEDLYNELLPMPFISQDLATKICKKMGDSFSDVLLIDFAIEIAYVDRKSKTLNIYYDSFEKKFTKCNCSACRPKCDCYVCRTKSKYRACKNSYELEEKDGEIWVVPKFYDNVCVRNPEGGFWYLDKITTDNDQKTLCDENSMEKFLKNHKNSPEINGNFIFEKDSRLYDKRQKTQKKKKDFYKQLPTTNRY